MEVDNDVIDTQLLQQFSSMGTNDKEVLIAEFQRLLGDQLNAAGCAFYLDMNNWNLQAAICSFYDLEQPQIRIPSMAFVKDITIGEGESIPPGTPFVKTWRILNSGDEAWPPGCCLKFVNGAQFGHQDRVMVDSINPGAMADISVEMISPTNTGLHQGRWRMATATGTHFGEFIWVIIQVEESGLLSVTQQMSQIGNEFTQHAPQAISNPFASPVKDSSSPRQYPFQGPLPLGNTSLEQNQVLLGSPMGSDIAQNGSYPNSPCVHQVTDTSRTVTDVSRQPSDSLRTALFSSSPNTPSPLTNLAEASMNQTDYPDSIEMS